ncbi:ribonuclease Z [Sanyastnella coralliicola]|uniref:ribonuclease Z n=1 Tax=Sanyastnella coralliicola TaxID=3069118 RepID=UPI0027B9A99D|nr:ribonuclease Z [Longitalea sp. SCSIO 12813]
MRHLPTSQLINVHDKLFLIDCGEGSQLQLRKYKFRFQRIDNIFISHLHGDHYLGLMGLLSSMHLLGRKKKLNLYAPPALQEILEVQFRASETRLSFEIEYINSIVKETTLLYEDRTVEVYAFPLKHRVKCSGFLFTEKERKAKVMRPKIQEFGLTVSEILAAKEKRDIERESGEVIKWQWVTHLPEPPRKYAFCSDTAYSEKVIEAVKGVDLLYHEATFLSNLEKRAKETFHTTAAQAGEVAKKAKVGQLMIGHFSSRYSDDDLLLEETKTVFENAIAANEGLTVAVQSHDNSQA